MIDSDISAVASRIATISTNYHRAVRGGTDRKIALSTATGQLVIALGNVKSNTILLAFLVETLSRRKAVYVQNAYVLLSMHCW